MDGRHVTAAQREHDTLQDAQPQAVPVTMEAHDSIQQDDDTADRQRRMLEGIKTHLALMESRIPEVQQLLAAFSDTAKSPTLGGLPTLLRSFTKEQETAEWLVSSLTEAALSAEALKDLSKKLDACLTDIARGALHWDIVKRCRSLVTVQQTFQGSARDDRRKQVSQTVLSGSEKTRLHRMLKEQGKVEVDIVDGGSEWLDIRTLQPDRLARQMTDCGWGWGDYEPGDCVPEEEWEDIPLAKQVRRVIGAARINRHEYQFPRVRVVLPRLSRANRDFDVFFNQLSRIDPLVEVAIEDCDSLFVTTPPPPLDIAIENLVGDPLFGLTQTLNVDHTILVDLISDLTHCLLEPQPWQASTTRAQIHEEKRHGGLMARTLYPVLQGRELVCTREAAEHFHEVLRTVGTSTERERGRLLVPWGAASQALTQDLTDAAIRARFQALSIHPLPPSVQIPVRIIAEEWTPATVRQAVDSGRLPHVALDVARCGGLKSSKLSIYMHGWAAGLATVTSNKEVRGQMRTWVEANRHDEAERGPRIWRIDVTRNLLAKSAEPPEGFDRFGDKGE